MVLLKGEQTQEAVRSGRANLGVAALDVVPNDLRADPIAHIEMSVVLPQDHQLAGATTVSLSDLEGASLVVPPPGRPHRQMIEVMLRSRGIEWKVAVEASGWGLTLHFVSLGLGVAIVNSFCAAPPGFVTRPLDGLPSRTYFVLSRAQGQLEGGALELKEIIEERCQKWL